ncbi:murein biosynthesis integral membrane protein MurJ [Conexibacter sp. DBS9H8]|uniref:murein biosynthesis integral membrane protein MurJ n=1 Tax=Conexibacter sp. DBS9H8 TaxID=2937801 RepID=UPI00200F3614|nr:murein biosynthesis integral membrane protein MurJ [Conexibacter sp. DBS9H8]
MSTAIFGLFTAVSRVIGLIREIVVDALFGQGRAMSAFTIASQVPNLLTNLFAQAALSAAFVPVFTDLLERGRKREATALASTLLWIILIALGALTVVGIVLAGVVLPLFSGPTFDGQLAGLLTQILFPVVLALGVTGLLVGILQSYDRFSLAAFVPVVWNGVIILLTVVLHSDFRHGVEAYAIAWLVATLVQLLMVAWGLRQIDFRLQFSVDWRNPLVRQVFALMLPVTIGLGIANLDALINSSFGALVNAGGPRAIQNAFLIYMLPQGIFSVAITTVRFPTLARQASRRDARGMRHSLAGGIRQINLLLIPSAVGILLLAAPIVQLLFQHGVFTHADTLECALALRWFAVALPFSGVNLLLTRTFFALQRPWLPARYAAINMTVDIIVSVALYRPFGVAGLVVGTLSANLVMVILQLRRLQIGFNGRLDLAQTRMITARILLAALLCGLVARVVWSAVASVLGDSIPAQLIAVGLAIVLAGAFYAWAVTRMRIPEARQLQTLLSRRLARSPSVEVHP